MKQNRYAGEQTVVYTFFNTFCCQRPIKQRAAKIISSFKLVIVIVFRYNKRVKDIQDAAAQALATRYASKVNSRFAKSQIYSTAYDSKDSAMHYGIENMTRARRLDKSSS